MFKKVRQKVILSAMAAIFVVTAAFIITINVINYVQVTGNLRTVMNDLAPRFVSPDGKDHEPESEQIGRKSNHKNRRNTAQAQYAGRYFVIRVSDDGAISSSGGSIALTEEEASDLTQAILKKNKTEGYYNSYRYEVSESDDPMSSGIIILCLLDCTTEIDAMRSLLLISIFVGLAGLALSFLFIYAMSAKAIWPLKESMEKQKQFITDAGHELKTPLSVIGTNMDILSMDYPENEWVLGTKKQVGKMRDLIGHLISLSRLEEEGTVLEMRPFNLSQAVTDTADAFAGIGEMNGTPLQSEIEDNLTANADEASVIQLLSILTDNALKYALPETVVMLRLMKQGKHICFETVNAWDQATPPDQLDRFFDRFYRADKSRSGGSKTKGYGLGLSIAHAIAEKNHLSLTVSEDAEHRIVFRVLFP